MKKVDYWGIAVSIALFASAIFCLIWVYIVEQVSAFNVFRIVLGAFSIVYAAFAFYVARTGKPLWVIRVEHIECTAATSEQTEYEVQAKRIV